MITFYRSKSSFNSKNLADFIDTPECIEIRKHMYSVLENDPLFHRPEGNQTLDDIRKRTQLQAKRIIDYGFLHDHRGKTMPLYYQALVTALVQYDICVLFKSTISVHFFGACIRGLGTAEQQKYFDDAYDEKLSGCFALTEVAHGTDAKRMRTTATYDPHTKEFILHSEDFESAKCWIGNLVFSLGTLIGGRMATLNMCVALLSNAVTIAVRYSAVRQQFGPSDDCELSIIEYPLQQWRLFPYLASLFAMKAAARELQVRHFYLTRKLHDPTQLISQEEMNALTEMHALLSACKAVFSWTTQAAIQQCREACGGHGYLKCAGFAGLRNDNDASCTYEGDNNVLQQQASQWVVRLWGQRQEQRDQFPLGSVDLLYRSRADHMSAASEREFCHPPVLLEAYEWLVCWLAEKTSQLYQSQVERGTDRFTARNHSQVYRGRSLSLAYAEHYMLKCLWKQCEAAEQQCADSHGVLTQLCALFGLSSLEKHQVFLHQGGYIDNSQSEMIHSAILTVCGQLKNEAVSLVDVVAPPDFILNSVLGHSSGKVYKYLEQALMTTAGNLERPAWWTELSGKFRSRL
ncbi:peroxisomal acyl-coenzyme A oxidase 3-like isoform X2 [Homalodisca vitripennis]|uniref:peroxisomal acyl-coenzyme A oxidase 3-like isoform X2 n=1 Tax=Homalodisca vitripennis TaxID=197043 RepID=UPI001EEB191E|nr:peroxisomal acyl-coenzyme A oxidase 3-like isoform X2 [Homalodisca vitripennis]